MILFQLFTLKLQALPTSNRFSFKQYSMQMYHQYSMQNANVSPISQTKLKLISNKLLKRSTSEECPISKMVLRNRVKKFATVLARTKEKLSSYHIFFVLLPAVKIWYSWKVLPF